MSCYLANGEESCNTPPLLSTDFNDNDDDNVNDKLDVKSHGTIKFSQNYCNKANFVRISTDSNPLKVKRLFISQNQDQRLTLVISTLGSPKESFMRSKLFRIFRESLLNIAQTTDIYMITAGFNSRVAKFYGEISRTNPNPSRPIQLIGIVSWGCAAGRELLDVQGSEVLYSKLKSDTKSEIPLEPNHTNFIFIDDGTERKHKCAVQFRGQFERKIISDKSTPQSGKIPLIIIVIEGCADAIKKAYRNIVEDCTPVIFVEGSGGCCDLFAKCYRLYNSYKIKPHSCDPTNEESVLAEENEKIKTTIRQSLQIVDIQLAQTSCTNAPHDGTDFFDLIYECVEKRSQCLNFVDLRTHSITGDNITLSILEALFKVNYNNDSTNMTEKQKYEQLNLAYKWKQIDFVKESIMKYDQDWKTIDLKELFETALLENQADFLQLMLDHDFQINDLFENNDKLSKLYQNENFTFTDEINGPLRAIYRELVQPFIHNVFQVDGIFDPDDRPKNSSKKTSTKQRNISSNNSSSIFTEMDVNKELFLWSINFDDDDDLGAAFMAVLVYKSKARIEKNTKYIEWANEMEQLAVDILEKFHDNNVSKCKQAIIRAVREYDNVSWLQLAVIAESKAFISKQAVQDVLKDIWYGRIAQGNGHLNIVFSSIMLWYSGFLSYDAISDEIIDEPIDITNCPDESNSTQSFTPFFTSNIKCIDNDPDTTRLRLINVHCRDEENIKMSRDNNSRQRRNSTRKKIQSIFRKFAMYFAIFWNKLDLVGIILFFIAVVLRFLPVDQGFCIARAILAIDLSIWCVRTLDIFSAVKRLGPKLVMIGTMVADLTFFMFMLGLIILAFGVPTYGLLNGVEDFSWHIPRKIINLAYWDIFGEVQAIDDIEKNYGVSGYVMFFLLVAYTTVASILLVNLLIAMFTTTFDLLHNDADCIWKFQQYSLVCYHSRRPLLPPPLIILSHIWRVIIYLFSHVFETKSFYKRYMKRKNRAKFKIYVNAMLTKQIQEIEDALGNEVFLFSLKPNRTQINNSKLSCEEQDYSIQETVLNRIKTLENQVQSIQNQQNNVIQHLEILLNGMKSLTGNNESFKKRS
ncbi:hypothetical protein I4U23_020794 [Adineta vaga]|nr:hypothetical protein I4U23_020794 [Adineta vaga]